jgi:hypothetical protein
LKPAGLIEPKIRAKANPAISPIVTPTSGLRLGLNASMGFNR